MALPQATLRSNQLDAMRKNLLNIGYLIDQTPVPDLTTYRDGGQGWTVLEVVCHLRDFENVFLQRARLTVEQELPPLPFPKPDELAAQNRYSEQDIHAVYADWKTRRSELLAYLEGLNESAWGREAIHPTRGQMSLFDQVVICAWHDINHLEQMLRTLHEKK